MNNAITTNSYYGPNICLFKTIFNLHTPSHTILDWTVMLIML